MNCTVEYEQQAFLWLILQLWIWAPTCPHPLHTFKHDHKNRFKAIGEITRSSRCLQEQEWLHSDAQGTFSSGISAREWRRRSSSGSEGRSHFETTWEGNGEETFRAGEEKKETFRKRLDHPEYSFLSCENKWNKKYSHGEKHKISLSFHFNWVGREAVCKRKKQAQP